MDLFDSMKDKHILIQDVGNIEELQRFIGHNIYRRDQQSADRIDFFAPYFTLPAKEKVGINGICCYSPILLILKDVTIEDVELTFAQEREKLQKVFGNLPVFKWESGVNLFNNEDKKYTYYFLGESIALTKPILKQNPPEGKLNLNSVLVPNLLKPMADFCEAAKA